MKRVNAIHLSLWAAFTVFLFLTGCTGHNLQSTKGISNKLNLNELYYAYNVHSEDLSSRSKCEGSPTIKIVNIEPRIEDYEIFKDHMDNTGFINPKEMMDSVVLYLKNGFEQSNIKGDDQSSKVLQIAMIGMKSTMNFMSWGAYFKIGLIIPETGFTKFYAARDQARHPFIALAYVIHGVTRQIIEDHVVQNYILCKDEYIQTKDQKDETASKSLSQKLQELQTTLDNGLISKEEYQSTRQRLLEKY